MALFRPHLIFNRITDIPIDYLINMGIKGVALDADNTLSTHHSQIPLDGVTDWLAAARENGIKVMIVSNARARRIVPFAQTLGLSYISLACKPLPIGFIRAARAMGVRCGEVAAIGDQLFTDVMGARLAGVKPLLVTPIKVEDGASFRLRRRLERPLIEKYERIGLHFDLQSDLGGHHVS